MESLPQAQLHTILFVTIHVRALAADHSSGLFSYAMSKAFQGPSQPTTQHAMFMFITHHKKHPNVFFGNLAQCNNPALIFMPKEDTQHSQ